MTNYSPVPFGLRRPESGGYYDDCSRHRRCRLRRVSHRSLTREQGHDVVIFDSLELGHRSAVAGVPLIKGDIADRATVRRAIEQYKVDSVLHFAAYKSPVESHG